MLAVERQSRKKPKELQDLITLPESMWGCWSHFLALDSTRTSNGYGANPLSFTDIRSYFELIQETPEPWEIRLINQLDRTILEVYAKQTEKEMKSKK